MSSAFELVKGNKLIIGMVHCLPLPGTIRSNNTIDDVIERAVSDAIVIEKSGFDALIVENEDMCVARNLSKMQFASMSIVINAVRQNVSIPIGISLGCLNYEEALAIAAVVHADFIRTPVFVDTLLNYNGIIQPCSTSVINYRNMIGGNSIKIFADIQVKHYHMLKDIDICESAAWAEKQGADVIIVTGVSTGKETKSSDLEKVSNACGIPVAVGSGITEENIKEKLKYADILIVGTSIKVDGKLNKPVDAHKAKRIINSARI